MREGCGRRWVRQVVGWNVHGLNGGDRARLRGCDALLEHSHLLCQRRLVTHRGWHATEQRGHFRAGERVAVDVVDEEQHVAALARCRLLITEVLGHGEARERDAQAVAGRLVHLPVHHGHFRLRQILQVDDAGFRHLVIEVVALASALTDTGKHRQTCVRLRDVVDELEHRHRLADARTAEQADLATLRERHQEVDDLDAGLEEILTARLLVIRRRRSMNRPVFLRFDRTPLILRIAEHVHDAPERTFADRYGDRLARRVDCQPALQAFGHTHRDGPHDAVAELLLHLERQVDVLELESLVDLRNLLARKFHVDDRADDLDDFTGRHSLVPRRG